MKWYIDDDGWPNSCLVSQAEMEKLNEEISDLSVSPTQSDPNLDDVQDESLLPEPPSPQQDARPPIAMNLLSLNCQGLGNLEAVASLESMIIFHKPHVVFLMETKLKKNGVEVLKHKLGFDKGDEVAATGRSGGLCILRKQEIDLVVKSKSENFIDAEIREDDNRRKWRFTGDFNQICSSAEKSGGRLRSEFQLTGFNNALEDCGLRDLGFIGYPFT
ncbi:hypothetical protein LINGRAHAP2_LOCUS34855 [Linum grandiflorum]